MPPESDSPARPNEFVVLVHGYSLLNLIGFLPAGSPKEQRWAHVCWGSPSSNEPGRIPVGVDLSWRLGARKLILGSGATYLVDGTPMRIKDEKPKEADRVLWEAQYSQRYLLDNLEGLASASSTMGGRDALERLRAYLSESLIVDTSASNTEEEVEHALEVCAEEGASFLVSVTSPSHSPRVSKILQSVRQQNSAFRRIVCLSSACLTDFGLGNETVIFEPSSVGASDREVDACMVFQDFFQLSEKVRQAMLNAAVAARQNP